MYTSGHIIYGVYFRISKHVQLKLCGSEIITGLPWKDLVILKAYYYIINY